MYEIFTPESEILKKHIYNFCILKKFDGAVNYVAFPQLGTSIAFYIDAKIFIGDNLIKISKATKELPKVIVLGKYTLPLQMNYNAFVPEIAINFTPAGLNYFFGQSFDTVAGNVAQLLDSEPWKVATIEMFAKKNADEKIAFLENFLLKNMKAKDLILVEKCLAKLNEDPDLNLKNLAKEFDVSTKTINRNFKSYIGCLPMDFKKIMRFRKAVFSKFDDPAKNLTQICYDNNFYDSPHFTREFKKLTGMNPKDFFANIKPAAENDFPYKFL